MTSSGLSIWFRLRYWEGDMPMCFWKTRLNWEKLAKPQDRAASVMGTRVLMSIYSVTSYIHAHYFEDLSLDTLAQKFYISSCYLSHQFKDVTGFTLTDTGTGGARWAGCR